MLLLLCRRGTGGLLARYTAGHEGNGGGGGKRENARCSGEREAKRDEERERERYIVGERCRDER